MDASKNVSNEVVINGVKIQYREPDDNNYSWIGGDEVLRFLTAALIKLDKNDNPMNPILVGDPGNGKTTLACSAAKNFNLPIYVVNCTSDMRPEDLIITPVIADNGKIVYRASSLLSAVINGGICVLDEANRMNERCWASLASILDDRRYLESVIAGIKIKAHHEFRLVATMNDDPSTYAIPGYIESRLKPVIGVEAPNSEQLYEIVKFNVSYAPETLIESVIKFLAENKDFRLSKNFSIRDAIEITRYAVRLSEKGEDYRKSFEQVMDLK